jgi:hypothetical protein
MTEQPEALRLADIIEQDPTTTWGYREASHAAAAELRRLHSVNNELAAALRRLISYCNTLENRLMEADGEHPAMQEAKEACAKVEGKA